MKLASAELDQKLATAKRDLIALGIAGAALFAGFSSIVAAVILLLSEAMEPWLAAGLVGLVSAVVGYVLLQRERRAAAELVPDKTIESVKKDVHTIREATHDSIQESRT
jgi:membrane-bound ClpP family serine protease